MSTLIFRDAHRYRLAQLAANARKLQTVFACETELQALAADALATFQPRLAVCHGARNGWECAARSLLGCEIIGTDIAPTAEQHGLIQMDFHDLPAHWINRFDLIYSNSLDHAHAPTLAVYHWVQSLRPGGRLYLSHWLHDRVERRGFPTAEPVVRLSRPAKARIALRTLVRCRLARRTA